MKTALETSEWYINFDRELETVTVEAWRFIQRGLRQRCGSRKPQNMN